MLTSELDISTSVATDMARPPRHYLPEEFYVTDWASLEPFFQELQTRALPDVAALEQWLLDRSELEAVLSEDLAWRYIRMTCDTQDESRAESFQFFVQDIEPQVAPYD
ncbi:MAG: M3 family oligoendopeptidase, partial [Hymenobacter sp.]